MCLWRWIKVTRRCPQHNHILSGCGSRRVFCKLSRPGRVPPSLSPQCPPAPSTALAEVLQERWTARCILSIPCLPRKVLALLCSQQGLHDCTRDTINMQMAYYCPDQGRALSAHVLTSRMVLVLPWIPASPWGKSLNFWQLLWLHWLMQLVGTTVAERGVSRVWGSEHLYVEGQGGPWRWA